MIVDTERATFRAWQETYRELGHELELERWLDAVGVLTPAFDAIAHLESLCGRGLDREAIDAARRRRKADLCRHEHARPGVEERLVEARSLDLLTAVVSNGTREFVLGHLERVGLAGGWDCVVCGERDPARAKPSPALYRELLARLELGADEAVAIEDSPAGVASAKAAGLACVAVPNEVTRQADLGAADAVVASLADVRVPELLDLVGRRRATA